MDSIAKTNTPEELGWAFDVTKGSRAGVDSYSFEVSGWNTKTNQVAPSRSIVATSSDRAIGLFCLRLPEPPDSARS